MRTPVRAWLGLIVLVAAWLPATPGRADPPSVAISIDPCVPVDRAALQRILTIEAGTSTMQQEPAAAPQAPTRVHIGCAHEGIQLRLEDGVTSKVMTRSLPARSFLDPSSTRLLALAVAEFVVASWIELEVQPEPTLQPLPVAPPPSPEALRAASAKVHALPSRRDATARTSLSLTGALQLYVLQDSPWLGAGARVLSTIGSTFAWSLSADFGGSGTDVAFGRVRTLSGSMSAAGLLQVRLGELVLFSGLALRFGLARIEGVSEDTARADGRVFFAPYGGPLWLTRLELAATELLRLGIELEIGYVTLPARATFAGRDLYAIDGLWGTTAVSIGIGL